MKQLLLAGALAVGVVGVGRAQQQAPALPLDSLTHKITYSAVVQVPGASKAELYSRAREWFATSFGSAKAVLEMDDKESGKLIGKAYAPVLLNSIMNQKVEARVWRVLKVEVKDGRYRYVITDFQTSTAMTASTPPTPVEQWLASFSRNGSKPTKLTESMVAGVKESAEREITSLSAAITKQGQKEKEW